MSHPSSPTRHLRVVALAFALFLGISSQAQLNVSVSLDPQHPGSEIPSNFVGLSFEMQRVLADSNGWHFFSPENKPLIATFKTLGIRSLRVGGNTADRPTLPVPSTADIDALFSFAKTVDVKVIFTLRLNHGDPAAAAEMASYISQHYAAQLDCFAIGNEPNVFSTNFDAYFTQWQRFAAQITSSVPDVKFSGPGVSPGHEKWSGQFAQILARNGRIKFITQHDYPGSDARKVKNPETARDRILSPAMNDRYARFAANFVPAIITNGLAFRLEEANSFYNGGAEDVSDTFASALWALNYQWWWAAHGMIGINFHTGDSVAAADENRPCRYATFWTATNGYNVHPIGYAEKTFSLGSQGKLIPAKIESVETNLNFAAYAVLGNDGNYYATLINASHGTAGTNYTVLFQVRGINGWQSGEFIRLATPDADVSRKLGVTLGGATIENDATWTGHWEKFPVPPDVHQFPLAVTLPAASAAVVKLTPR